MGCMNAREAAPACPCPHCGYLEEAEPGSPLHLPPRTLLRDGQYLLGKVLGHGGFGITYIGWERNLQRKLAVKEYFPSGVALRTGNGNEVAAFSGAAQQDFDYGLERYLEEARLLARFAHHPHVLSVLNFFRENGTAYIVTEYLEGRTLDQYLEQMGGRISLEEAVQLLTPVMEALEEVHAAGILHRDVSPDNIHLSPARRVKLLDFGAARIAIGERSRNLSVILKEGYAPSEQYRSRGNQGPWTDVYAVAATFYRCVTGVLPPPALDRMTDARLEPLTRYGVPASPALEQVIARAMAFDPRQRTPSIGEFRNALLEAVRTGLDSAPASGDSSPPAGLPRMPAWIWGLASAILVGALVLGGLYMLRRPPAAITTSPLRQARPVPIPDAASYEELLVQARAQPATQALALLERATRLAPDRAEAFDQMGQVYLYHSPTPARAETAYRKAIDRGGVATFRVAQMAPAKGAGEIRITSRGVTYLDRTGEQTFSVRKSDLLPASSADLRQWPEHDSFSIETKTGERYLFSGTSAHRALERDLIVGLLGEP